MRVSESKHVVQNDEFESFGDVCLYGSNNNNLKNYILLDNQSTVDIFCNKSLLHNIHNVKTDMTIETNGGTLTTNKKGYLKGHGSVWYHKDAITNILSLKIQSYI